MTDEELRSGTFEVADAFEAMELYYERGLTDGLPVVPPMPAAVLGALRGAGLDPSDLVGEEPVRRRRITAEKVAIVAVMAGCRPEYLPVVVAVVRALLDPAFGLHGATASTGGSAPFIVVNGPVRQALGMHARDNALGNGSRANATIGRAVRLLILNVLGGVPGQLDRSTLGHPGKFTFCVAEDEEGSAWVPLARLRGVPPGRSAVTVMAATSPHQVMHEWTRDPLELLATYVAAIRANMLTYSIWTGNYALVVPPQHRAVFEAAGWTKRDVQAYVHEAARVVRRDWRGVGKGAVVSRENEERIHTALRTPDDLLVVAAGGPAGGLGAVVPPWYGTKSLAVTRIVDDGRSGTEEEGP